MTSDLKRDLIAQGMAARPQLDMLRATKYSVNLGVPTMAISAPRRVHEYWVDRISREYDPKPGTGPLPEYSPDLYLPGVARGIEYAQQVNLVTYWAAIEAMAEDLWEAALNDAGPKLRAHMLSKNIKVPLSEVAVGLDKLGTLLKGHYSFLTVDRINEAYRQAFGIERILSCSDQFKIVEKVRHAIVHNAGMIDDAAVAGLKLAPSAKGKRIVIDALQTVSTMVGNEIMYMVQEVVAKLQQLDPLPPKQDIYHPNPSRMRPEIKLIEEGQCVRLVDATTTPP
jgi:hypothetical protein